MKTIDEVIELWTDFEQRCTAKRSEQINNIKEDRAFLSGEQWGIEDNRLISKNRPRRTINILSNSINSTTNLYANYPFKWYSPSNDIDNIANLFLKNGSNNRAAYNVLYNIVAFGVGYFAIGSENTIDNLGNSVEIPAIYSIDNVENVFFDPDSIELNGADAIEGAIVEYRSKNYIIAKYGREWVTEKGIKSIINTSENNNSEIQPIITYYRIEDGKCSVYKLLCDKFLEEPQQLNINKIPIIPCYGEKTWNNDKIIYQGLVRKGAPIQKIINYAFTQLAERMAVAPKPVFLTTPEAIEGFDEGYKNFSNNLNPLLLYNSTSPDRKENYNPPQRLDNQVQFSDITSIISANLELLSTITGVDAKGIIENGQPITATEVLYNERQTQTTIRHFYANLRDSFKAVGELVLNLLGYNELQLDVIQGPGEYMEKQVARQELLQIASLVPDTDKMKIVDGLLLSHGDNTILLNVFNSLHNTPQATQLEEQAFNTIEQMKQAIEQKNIEINNLQEQIKRYEDFTNNNEKSIQADLVMQDLKHKQELEKLAFEKKLNSTEDTNKIIMELQSKQIDLEKKAIELDIAKAKAGTEFLKNNINNTILNEVQK